MHRPLLPLALILLSFGAYAQEPQVQAFRLRFHSLSEATALLAPMLSGEGSLILHPSNETIVVRDRADVLARVAMTIRTWDVQPSDFAIDLSLVKASALPGPSLPMPAIDSDVLVGLRNLFGFKSFTLIDTLIIRASDGTPVETVAGTHYVLRFVPRWSAETVDRIILGSFELGRKDPLPSGIEAVRQIMRRSTVSVRFGQTSVIGIARSETAREALVLVLRVKRTEAR